MAKRQGTAGFRYEGDASSFVKATQQVRTSLKNVQKDVSDFKKDFSDFHEVFSSLNSDIGNVIQGFVNFAGPVGAVVALINGISSAWKKAKENVELYNNAADKLKFGGIGFEPDAEKALEDLRKRAKGMLWQAASIRGKAQLTGTNFGQAVYSDESRKQAEEMRKQADAMTEAARGIRALLDSPEERFQWTEKYKKLLIQQETLNDNGLLYAEQWEIMESKLMAIREKMSDPNLDPSKKEEAVADYARIANQLKQEKLKYTQDEIDNLTAIAQMTHTEEVYEDRLAALAKYKGTIEKEYGKDLVTNNKLLVRAGGLEKDRALATETGLYVLKQYNSMLYETYRAAMTFKQQEGTLPSVSTFDFSKYLGGVVAGRPAKANSISSMRQQLGITDDIEDSIVQMSSSFSRMFQTINDGFSGVVEGFVNGLKRIVASILAQAGILAFLQFVLIPLLPGKLGLGGLNLFTAKNILSGSFPGLKLPGFASGTNFAPGGLALVGERGPELVNLPRGSQVIPNGGFNERLVTRLNGKHIDIVLTRYYNELDVNS